VVDDGRRFLTQLWQAVERLGLHVPQHGPEGLGLAQQRQDTAQVTRRQERRAQGEPEIDGLLARVAVLGQMP
jgi:hypothetical protein